jgi:hypothetical protein
MVWRPVRDSELSSETQQESYRAFTSKRENFVRFSKVCRHHGKSAAWSQAEDIHRETRYLLQKDRWYATSATAMYPKHN